VLRLTSEFVHSLGFRSRFARMAVNSRRIRDFQGAVIVRRTPASNIFSSWKSNIDGFGTIQAKGTSMGVEIALENERVLARISLTNQAAPNCLGVTSFGGNGREAPAQAELRPACLGPERIGVCAYRRMSETTAWSVVSGRSSVVLGGRATG
jgi:hypothetical protein